MWLGPHYYVKVELRTSKELSVIMEDEEMGEVEGLWITSFVDEDANMGTIFVCRTLGLAKQWQVLRHELIHAIHDIDDWVRVRYGG